MSYVVNRYFGRPVSIRRLADARDIPLSLDNADYRDFLVWNAIQTSPLDLNIVFNLHEYKAAKVAAIRAKTTTILSRPILATTPAGEKPFFADLEASIDWNSLNSKKGKLTGVFPMDVTLATGRKHTVDNMIELDNITDDLFITGRAIKVVQTDLIDRVMAATTKAEVDAVIDDRT